MSWIEYDAWMEKIDEIESKMDDTGYARLRHIYSMADYHALRATLGQFPDAEYAAKLIRMRDRAQEVMQKYADNVE